MTDALRDATTELQRVVLFDFDHTLTDFGDRVRWVDARPAVQQVYRAAGVPDTFLEAHPGSITLYTAVAALEPLSGSALLQAQRRTSEVLAEFETEGIPGTEALPGARELLSALSHLGLRAGIVTSNAAIVVSAILERLRLDTPFEVLIDRDQVARLKPAPDGLLAACRALDVPPAAATYVGDSVADMEAATSAGLQAWGVSTGLGTPGALRAAGAVRVFVTLDDALAHLRENLAPVVR